MDGVAPSLWDCSARLPLAGGSRPAAILTRDREVPLSEERMVLYPNPPKTISPDDPCNNVASRPNTRHSCETRAALTRAAEVTALAPVLRSLAEQFTSTMWPRSRATVRKEFCLEKYGRDLPCRCCARGYRLECWDSRASVSSRLRKSRSSWSRPLPIRQRSRSRIRGSSPRHRRRWNSRRQQRRSYRLSIRRRAI